MKTLTFLIFLLAFPTLAAAQIGYKITPWGSKTWEGPGKQSHWHAATIKRSKSSDSIIKKKRRSHHRGLHYFYGPHHRIKYYRRTPVIIEKTVEPKVTHRKTVIKTRTRYVPAPQQQPSATLCGGDTVYFRNKATGEITIRYISPAKKCE